ncbi:MAG: GldG family protein [Anaerolineae bacterium]|nr:GldG family protein [Anaerolineae bacterium]
MAEKASPPNSYSLRAYAGVIALVGLLVLIGSGITYFLNPAWAAQTQIGAGIGAALLLTAAFLRPEAIRAALTGRQVKYASNAAVKSLAFIGILGLINFLVVKYEWEYDLTETGQFTLSEQTMQILQQLDRPVEVIGFFQNSDPRLKLANDYLERYRHYSDRLLVEFHDPEIEPILAEKYELSNYGLVFVSGDNRYETSGVDEQSITSGLVRVTNNADRNVYFITGHGEHSLNDGAEEGYSQVKQALEQEGYRVETLNLAASETIPADATVLVLAGADRELLNTEVKLVEDWLTAGGKLMLLVDPLEPAPLAGMLKTYGLALGNDFVIEDANYSLVTLGPDGLVPQIIAPLIYQYPYHEITRSLNGFQSFYPMARSITITPIEGIGKITWPLLSTSAGSWAETDLETAQPEYTPDVDLVGPLHLAAAAEDIENGVRLAVFGDAGFVTNQNASPQWANLDLFVNTVDWLAEEEDLISIRPKSPTNRNLFLTSMQITVTILTTLIIIPLAVLIAGLGLWWKRR